MSLCRARMQGEECRINTAKMPPDGYSRMEYTGKSGRESGRRRDPVYGYTASPVEAYKRGLATCW